MHLSEPVFMIIQYLDQIQGTVTYLNFHCMEMLHKESWIEFYCLIGSKFGYITVIEIWIAVKKRVLFQYMQSLIGFVKKLGKVSFTVILIK